MNLQGGDNNLSVNLCEYSFPYIRDGYQICNFGCGLLLNFEKDVIKHYKNVNITSVDVQDIKTDIDNVRIIKESVENKILFDDKFDLVTFFELMEHIDKTDILLENCFENLKDDGYLVFSCPNLASYHARLSLLLGFQPCIIEVSNINSKFGRGIFDKFFSGKNSTGETVHHIRGITYKAMKEMVKFYGFEIVDTFGYSHHRSWIFKYFPSIAPVDVFICKKSKV